MKNRLDHITRLSPPSSVVVALSGGIDSSFSAALLKEAGWDVYALHFHLPTTQSTARARENAAREVADFLGIPIEVLDFRDDFKKKIIDPFVDAYQNGLTPNPCVRCNEVFKFHNLVQYADRKGISYVSTGHYVRIEDAGTNAGVNLLRGQDKGKDQSYFLHRLKQTHLTRAVFPLGHLTKNDVRDLARQIGLPTHASPESQEVCFLPENDYRQLVEEKNAGGPNEGNIVTEDGTVVGRHSGAYRYTIGQRQGLGIASDRPFYVKEIRPENNEIMVARKEDLYSRHVEAGDFNWIGKHSPEDATIFAQIRYRHRAAPGQMERGSSGQVNFIFDDPQWAVTPGQALVFYHQDRLLGGGWIKK